MAPVPFIDDGAPAQGVGVLNRDGFLFGFLTGWGRVWIQRGVAGGVCALVVAGLVRGKCGQEAKVAGFVCVRVITYMHDMHTYVHIHM